MSRSNRLIDLVFSDITKRKDPNSIDVFLDTDDALALPVDPLLERYKALYSEIIGNIKEELELLSDLEEVIVQMRCKNYAPKDFNLSITNNSIYVKLLFYRDDRKIKDIRVIGGNISTFGRDLEALSKDQSFIDIFTEKAKAVMEKEIEKTISKVQNKMKKTCIYI